MPQASACNGGPVGDGQLEGGRQQGLGVGGLWSFEHLDRGAFLNDLAAFEHNDVVGKRPHDL
jgi:hypothetical protein